MKAGIVGLAAAAFALFASPAAAQQQNAYEAGVAARQAGQPAEARRLLMAWLADHPNDADAMLQLAYADLALGNVDAAEAGFEAVLRQAPDYTDARDGLAAVSARRASPAPEARGSVIVEGSLSDLGGGARGWSEVAADIETAISPRTTIGARAAYYRRFAREDVELVGRISLHPSDDVWLRAFVGGTPNADFRPEVAVGGGIDWRVTHGNATVLTLDASYQRFPLQDVITVNPGVVQYLAGGKAWLTLRGIGTVADGGPLEVGALARGDFVPASGWRVFAGASNGPDTDLGVVTRVKALFGGVEAPLSPRFGVTGSLAREWRDGPLDRTEFRLGLKARF
ncbi:YaiO family outer membrane beta-barrel protein [Altererythrobacter sp. TH136]|uniref:YaiO family outer membrane beta-barrel protein n=1 Tax=Altererythrobacter sp. TH136 TaxID=2067415 RepID=UPI0011631C5B|nr:YaiO family outer membrane beta-barrel protein [Altererythrobacter sp. TH136]QDM40606.1 YaiO family outer membrane beta-barrel protein [Altererythrobacter sp. TH136]